MKYTPQLHAVIPNEVYFGQRVDFMTNPMASIVENEKDMDPIMGMKIGRVNVNYEGMIDSGSPK
jgi:hypothetical protein